MFVPDTFVPTEFVPTAFVPNAFASTEFVPNTFVPTTYSPTALAHPAPRLRCPCGNPQLAVLWCWQEDLFVLSGSFGALSTLVFALPAVPLTQPRVILSAHTLAMGVSVSEM